MIKNFSGIWHFFTAPRYPEETLARREFATKAILAAQGIALSLSALLITLGWLRSIIDFEGVVIISVLTFPTWFGWWLAHRGRWRAARVIPSVLFFLLGTYGSVESPFGIYPLLAFILSIMLGAMLLDTRLQWIIVGISLGFYLIPAWYLGELIPSAFLMAAFSVGVVFLGVAILQWVYNDQLVGTNQALRRSLEETAHNQRLLLALSQAAQAVQRVRTLEQIYSTVGREVVNVGYHAVIFTSTGGGANLELSYLTFEPSITKKLKRMTGLSARDYVIPVRPGSFYDGLIKKGQPIFVERLELPLAETLPVEKRGLTAEVLTLLEIEQAIYAPLVVDDQLCGLLMVTGLGLRETDVPAVSAFANQAAVAIESTRLLDQVRTGRERLQELAKRLVTAQEEERRHLSRELHDEAGQALTALKIDLKLIKSDLLENPTKLGKRLTRAANLTDVIQERLRSTAQGLRPPALDVTGLNVTLEDYCKNFKDCTQLEVTYQGMDFAELPEITEITLYRFVQESLTNVARHAQASQIRVRLQENNGAASLSVEDDGIGFDAQAVMSTTRSVNGMGLLGVRERLELVGGWLEVDSQPGEGTRLVAHVPVERDYLERRRGR